MLVFKFGGASISSLDRIKNIAEILYPFQSCPLMVIISAMGKTTNALEKVAEAFYAGRNEDAIQLFHQIKQQHLNTAKFLLVSHYNPCYNQLNDFFTEVEWLLNDKPVREYDYYYDQVVCIGEMLSTCILSHFLAEAGLKNTWLDVRDVIRTDNNYRDANIDWTATEEQIGNAVKPLLTSGNMVITQGFVGSTYDNESTTLGREGSDYSAAIFANVLHAESLTIWKDVPSVMNADPRQFPDAVPISELSFEEVIEMAYYGAQVIHPKTIKPLWQKRIPLLVKCFLDPDLPGTTITRKPSTGLPPIYVKKENQVMVEFQSRDYSFIGEHAVGQIFHSFEQENMKPNLTQNGAIRFMAIFDDKGEKLEHIALKAEALVNVMMRKNLALLTIRHYTPEAIEKMLNGQHPLLVQQTPDTWQAVVSMITREDSRSGPGS